MWTLSDTLHKSGQMVFLYLAICRQLIMGGYKLFGDPFQRKVASRSQIV